ncbi:MAG: hypothetical protein FWH04_06115 [Oscillospiraceae bacterium]|nr:hypothetical protein [Oscillospiraceae bacterium]
MAEFCHKCYKKELGGIKELKGVVLSKCLELCEGCGEYKNIVIAEKKINNISLKLYGALRR